MVLKSRLKSLPSVIELKRLTQSLAMLDAIMSSDWEYRYYSFNSKWSKDEMMASMRDCSGDGYFILFNSLGVIIKGFSHEAPMSPYSNRDYKVWKGVLDSVPTEFQSFFDEPAFSMEDTTFCIWRKHTDSSWQAGKIKYPKDETNDPDGSENMLFIFDCKPSTYKGFAESYYEKEIPLWAIEKIYLHEPLTDEIVKSLNPESSKKKLKKEIEEIAYPNE